MGEDKMHIKRIFRFVCLVLLAMILGGCSPPVKTFNKYDNQNLKKIGVLEPAHKKGGCFVLHRGDPRGLIPIVGTGIVLGEESSRREEFNSLLKSHGFDFVKELQSNLAAELQSLGYSVEFLNPERDINLSPKLKKLDADVDAYLDSFIEAGYKCEGGVANPGEPYKPRVQISVHLIKPGLKEPLYQKYFFYGVKVKGAVNIAADEQYFFKDYPTLISEAERAIQGLRTPISLAVKCVSDDLAR